MYFDYEQLTARIIEIFRDRNGFALKMQLSEAVINSRIQNKTQFRKEEIDRAVVLLNIADDTISDYFFKIEKDERSLFEKM